MKIAFVTELFYPSTGGQEFRFMQLAKGLVKKNVEVEVYTSDHLGSLTKEERIDGIHVMRFVTLRNYVKPSSRGFIPLAKYISATSKIIKKLVNRYDYILVNQMPILHLPFILSNDKIVIDWCETYEKGLLKYILLYGAKKFKRGIAVSEDIANTIRLFNPLMNVEVVRTPINIDKYTCDKKDKELILFVGRLVPHKNIISLIDAISYINTFFSQKKRLEIVGDGPLRQILANKQRKYQYIKILGKINEEEKVKLIRRASLLALPSLREGFPNVVAEAIAACTPILTVKAPLNNVYRFVERHKIGFVAPSPSSKDLAKTIIKIDDNAWYFAMRNEMKLRDEFKEENVINRLLRFLKENVNEE
jgi:glycosyltransferase involved in cell wall biosynthesis